MIGIFNDNYPPILDGVALTARNYAYWLHQRGEEVCVVTPYAPEAPAEEGFPVYRYPSLPIPMRPPYRFGLPYIDARFRHRLTKMPFELIHAHCPFTSGYLALNLAHHKAHCPMVATFHSKYRQDFERALHVDKAVDLMIDNIVRFYNKADEVWIPQANVEDVLRDYGFTGHVEIVENGSDFLTSEEDYLHLRAEGRRQLGLKENETMLFFVGQHIWEKKIGLIIDALALLKNYPYRMYFCGTGYAVKEMKQRIHSLGLEQKITLLGLETDRERLKMLYAASDVFLFPSLYDTFSLVMREAAALRTPTILLRTASISTAITDGVNGFLAEDTPADYAQKIVFCIEHPDVVNRVGRRASETIVRSWENVVDEVILRYRDIIHAYHKKN